MIEVEGLVKMYGLRHKTLGVDQVSFSIPRGARFGILGAAGAGKSTIIRILATAIRPTAGTVRIGGHDVLDEPAAIRALLGYVPQDLDFRGWRSGLLYLRFWARVCGLSTEMQRDRIANVVDFLQLTEEIERDPTERTIDVQKRVSLAQAMLTDPEVLLLDEPISGLGDAGRRFVVERLERLTAAGKTIVLSSPLVADIRAACDQVAVMSEGHVSRSLGVRELLVKVGEGKDARIFIDCDALTPESVAALKALKGVIDVQSAPTATIVYVVPTEAEPEEIRRTLEGRGVQVRSIRIARLQLGDVFSALNA